MSGEQQGLEPVNSDSMPDAIVAKPEHLVRAHPILVQRVGPRPRTPEAHDHLTCTLPGSMECQVALGNDSAKRVRPKAVSVALTHASL
jgi:hypothetical protein